MTASDTRKNTASNIYPRPQTRPDISITGARHHNLKNINVSIPAGKITVITGRSGSGKSTLAMDVLFAEGQHRYLQSLGQDAASGLKLWDRPDADAINHLPPPVALFQKRPRSHHLSTVATLTSIKSLLRVLYAAAGTPSCPSCDAPLDAMTIDQIVDALIRYPEGSRLIIMAPVTHLFQSMPLAEALRTVREQGFLRVLINGSLFYADQPQDLPSEIQDAQLIVDRIVTKPGVAPRVNDSSLLALKAGNGIMKAEIMPKGSKKESSFILTFTEHLLCTHCMKRFPELKPAHFSMLEYCSNEQIEKQLPAWMDAEEMREFISAVEVNQKRWDAVFQLTVDELNRWLDQGLSKMEKDTAALIHGRAAAAHRIMENIRSKILPVVNMGLGYIKLNRRADTLSAGELQRLRLGEQLSRSMSGVLYILDEPSTGLHPAEHELLWQHILSLREAGNTVIIIEHDTWFMDRADHIIELGPGAGREGGQLIFSGSPAEMKQSGTATISGPWLSGKKHLNRGEMPPAPSRWIKFSGMQTNNLKDISISIPLERLTCIAGLSGSGKSSLVSEIVRTLSETDQHKEAGNHGNEHITTSDGSMLPCAFLMDQSPVSGSITSIPATWMGVFTHIRNLFARTPEARKRGLSAGWFSLSKKGGRCETCKGRGTILTDLKFLPPVESQCNVCNGRRYNRDTLSIHYRHASIADVLDMTISEAINLFSTISTIVRPLEWLERTGLAYLKMGQHTSTLSGGEAQRLKLARELARKTTQAALYILDEPTSGLHPEDVNIIMDIFHDLISQGHTVIMVEHDIRAVSAADYVIELGPGADRNGGDIIFQGTPGEMAEDKNSVTGPYMKNITQDLRHPAS